MIIYQKLIFRDDLQKNPNVYYLFGDNMLRMGMGGQAKEMRGEPNAIGIATKKSPAVYMSDKELYLNAKTLWEDLQPAFFRIIADKPIIIPTDGLGTGLSAMPKECPITYKHLAGMLGWLGEINRAPLYVRDDLMSEKEERMKNYLEGRV